MTDSSDNNEEPSEGLQKDELADALSQIRTQIVGEGKPKSADSVDEHDEEEKEKKSAEVLSQMRTQEVHMTNWGWRAVVAATIAGFIGAGLMGSGFLISEYIGSGVKTREQAARIEFLETESAGLRAALSAAEDDLNRLAERFDTVDETLGGLRGAMGAATAIADLETLAVNVDRRLETLETAQDNPPDQAQADALIEMSNRLTALETRTQSIGALAGDEMVVPSNSILTARITELEQYLAELDFGLAAAMEAITGERLIGPDLGEVETRIKAVEEAIRSLGPDASSRGSASALVLAVGQLRVRLVGAGPFRTELDTVRRVAQARQLVDRDLQNAMNRLGGLASDGVVTTDQLTREFSDLASQIVRAAAPNTGWVAELWREVGGLVSVRRIGEVKGDSIEAIVARAEVRLGDRDLAGAVAELESLEGLAAGLVKPWLELARARAIADEAVTLISTRALAMLAQEFGAEP